MVGSQCKMNYSFPSSYEIWVVGNGAFCGSNPLTLPSSSLFEDRERRRVRPESVTVAPHDAQMSSLLVSCGLWSCNVEVPNCGDCVPSRGDLNLIFRALPFSKERDTWNPCN